MESIIHADIFFFIATIILCIIGIFITIILIYIIKIIIDIREISKIARNESADISNDIKNIRMEINDELRRNSSIVISIIRIIRNLFNRSKTRINRK